MWIQYPSSGEYTATKFQASKYLIIYIYINIKTLSGKLNHNLNIVRFL